MTTPDEAPAPLIVFVSGLYPPDGRDSVSIQNRDYLIGLHDRGVPVAALDMADQGSASTLIAMARSIAVHTRARGWERVGNWTARQMIRQRWMLLPAVSALRGAQRIPHRPPAPRLQDEDRAIPQDTEAARVRALRMRSNGSASPWANVRRVACVVNGYDLLFSPGWGRVWRESVEVVLRGACPRATQFHWFVHVVNETTRIAPALLHGLRFFDEVWAASQFQVDALRNSGFAHPQIHTIGEAVDTDIFRPGVVPLTIPGRRRVCFLTLSQYGLAEMRPSSGQSTRDLARAWNHIRKYSELLLRAFVEEFRADEDVSLVVKSTADVEQLRTELAALLRKLGTGESRASQVIPIGGWIDRRELPRLYAASDAFVLASRGEGWGRPLAEAMAMGIPAIGTRFGGNTEFMNVANSYLVDYTSVQVSDTMGPKSASLGEWAEPSVQQLRAHLRAIVSDPDQARRRGAQAAVDIREHYSRRALADAILRRVRASLQEHA